MRDTDLLSTDHHVLAREVQTFIGMSGDRSSRDSHPTVPAIEVCGIMSVYETKLSMIERLFAVSTVTAVSYDTLLISLSELCSMRKPQFAH